MFPTYLAPLPFILFIAGIILERKAPSRLNEPQHTLWNDILSGNRKYFPIAIGFGLVAIAFSPLLLNNRAIGIIGLAGLFAYNIGILAWNFIRFKRAGFPNTFLAQQATGAVCKLAVYLFFGARLFFKEELG